MTAPRPAPRGELHLVPDIPYQVKEVVLKVEQLDNGLLRFTMPKAPGWVQAGRGPVDVVRILRSAFTERQVAAVSAWRGTTYDHPATPQHKRAKPASRGKKRCDVYDPLAWLVDDRGLWVSPKGLHYPESRKVVQRVIDARRAMGLPDRPSAADSRFRLEDRAGTQLAMEIEGDAS